MPPKLLQFHAVRLYQPGAGRNPFVQCCTTAIQYGFGSGLLSTPQNRFHPADFYAGRQATAEGHPRKRAASQETFKMFHETNHLRFGNGRPYLVDLRLCFVQRIYDFDAESGRLTDLYEIVGDAFTRKGGLNDMPVVPA